MRFSGLNENDFVDSFNNISVSFWTQGCPHRCEECHNPETWDYDGGYELPSDYKEKILESLHKNGIERDLSVLGGEPLCDSNLTIVYDLVKYVKENSPLTKVILWTGYTFEDIIDSEKRCILDYIDIMIDGKFDIDKHVRDLYLKGSTNQRVIDVVESLSTCKVSIIY